MSKRACIDMGILEGILVSLLVGNKVGILVGRHWQAGRRGGQSTPEMQRLPMIALLLPGHCKANAVCSLWCALHTVQHVECYMQRVLCSCP